MTGRHTMAAAGRWAAMLLLTATAASAVPALNRVAGEAAAGTIEIGGVQAGAFRPEWWEAGTLNLVADAREPLLEPREGPCRNIYAPTVVREGARWRVYYGAWDGVETGNDRIYTMWTTDFLTFHDRRMVIDHGVYTHVCNCSAIRLPSGEYRMMCTAYPHRKGGRNRPAIYESPDGLAWNGGPSPYPAAYSDLTTIEGYEGWEQADINGMNVILYEDGQYRLYFGDFAHFGQVHRASSRDFHRFTYEGPVLEAPVAVNDVKRLDLPSGRWYLMACHMNGNRMWYALSRDGMAFGPRHMLTESQYPAADGGPAADRYMVAVGWVVDGQSVLGFIYGAGAVSSLDRNRLFAQWLQRRVEFRPDGGPALVARRALGPDTACLVLPGGALRGRFRVLAEDGRTVLWRSRQMTIEAGQRWQFVP